MSNIHFSVHRNFVARAPERSGQALDLRALTPKERARSSFGRIARLALILASATATSLLVLGFLSRF